MNINEFENLTGPVVIVPFPFKFTGLFFRMYAYSEDNDADKSYQRQVRGKTKF